MKKSISINISGMLFNIEEDAYERLKRYLDEIKHYFAGYEASDEIVADIENRVAEIFSTKVNPGKQVITTTDVEALIAQMGNIRDFAAVEDTYDEPKYSSSSNSSSTGSKTNAHSYTTTEDSHTSRRLYKDRSRKIIGGVAAGIARYMHIDPLWVRLLMVVILFDLFLTFSFSSALLIGYIILWFALPDAPASTAEEKKVKKMFRNPDDKVISGVSGGLAAYFGVDATLIRVMFVVLFIVGGSGLLLYILLWIIMPMARTITDRMQMQGEPVTLANIEHQVKKNLNFKEGEEESLPVKILLFPFRLVAALFAGGSRGIQPLAHFVADAARIIAGLVLSAVGFFSLLAILVSMAVLLGSYNTAHLSLMELELPLELLRNTIPDYLLAAVLLLAAIPALFILLAGIALLANRSVVPAGVSWSLAGIWLIALIAVGVMAPDVAINYRTNDYHKTTAQYVADPTQTLVLQMEKGSWKNLHNIDLTIKGSADSTLRLEQQIWAHGANSEEAREHAQLSSYPVTQKGNTLLFADQLKLPKDKPFYAQHAKATLYIPYGQPFTMEYGMRRILYNTLSPWGYRSSDLGGNTFAYNQKGELECLSCPTERVQEASQGKYFSYAEGGRTLNYKDFDKVKVGSNYRLTVQQGSEYKVEVSGNEQDLDEMEVKQRNGMLSFLKKDWNKWWKGDNSKSVHINIWAPSLAGLYMSGASRADVRLKQDKPMEVELSGASEMTGSLEVEELDLEMSGNSELNLKGQCRKLIADLSGASELVADQFKSAIARMDLSGASNAKIWATDQLNADLSGGSDLVYKGNPNKTSFDQSGGADIRRMQGE